MILGGLVMNACGYHMGAGPAAPASFGTVAVPILVNQSSEPNIQAVITHALIRDIRSYSNRSMARTAGSTVSEYRLSVLIDLELKDRKGKIFYQNASAQLREEYYASPILEQNEIAEAEALKSGAIDFAQDQVRYILDGINSGLGNDRL
jgi:hypothetical protein